jgi:alkanesulfonate monooxygenase SsuD/methylene tetrahydromethanopterin reductase-like flavin-dependent oxidoreductase (luciferase family)
VLSQGRVIVGIGAGWMEEEFQAIGAPPFSERGKVTDEYLRAFKTLWTDDNPRFQGKYVQFDNVSFLPKPVQKPHPPIWVGGESPAALRRTAELGDAWYPIGSNPEFPLNTAERFSQGIARLHDAARKAGRDPASIRLTYWASWYKEGQTLNVDNGQRQVFTGSDDDVVRDIKDFGALGVKDLLFTFARPTLGESLAAMERFSDKVLARV